jgi:hypothetical protein
MSRFCRLHHAFGFLSMFVLLRGVVQNSHDCSYMKIDLGKQPLSPILFRVPQQYPALGQLHPHVLFP